MSDWLNIHPKIFMAVIVAGILILAGPQLKTLGIDVSSTWQTLLPLLAGYLTPGVNGAPKV